MLLKAGRTGFTRDMGGFVVRPNMPGWLLPRPIDHGHGALAMVVESFLDPGRLIAMHEHRNDEIISWVPDGVMRHDDRSYGELVTDAEHLLVMNAGSSFWHSERTLPTDPPLRMLQIMVRPHSADLPPMVQHGRLPPPAPNVWRHLVGPEGSGAPFFVRNTLDLFDIRLAPGARATMPAMAGRDAYFYVFSGAVALGGRSFGEAEQGLIVGEAGLTLEAKAPSVVVTFLVDPVAGVVREGTVGDSGGIPPPALAKPLLWLLGAWDWIRRLAWKA